MKSSESTQQAPARTRDFNLAPFRRTLQAAPASLARAAYAKTLQQHHGWAVSTAVRTAFMAVPGRDQMRQAFGLESEAAVTGELAATTMAMRPVVETIMGWFATNGYDWDDKAGV